MDLRGNKRQISPPKHSFYFRRANRKIRLLTNETIESNVRSSCFKAASFHLKCRSNSQGKQTETQFLRAQPNHGKSKKQELLNSNGKSSCRCQRKGSPFDRQWRFAIVSQSSLLASAKADGRRPCTSSKRLRLQVEASSSI